MLSNRESLPSSAVIRLNRNEPTGFWLVQSVGTLEFWDGCYVRLVAQMATAALNTTCLQFQAVTAPLLLRLASKLGHAGRGVAPPAAAATARALKVGRYRLSAVQEI